MAGNLTDVLHDVLASFPNPDQRDECVAHLLGEQSGLRITTEDEPHYDRAVLVDVLVYHYRKGIEGCGCGWAELGRSWPEHVATVYEESVTGKVTRSG